MAKLSWTRNSGSWFFYAASSTYGPAEPFGSRQGHTSNEAILNASFSDLAPRTQLSARGAPTVQSFARNYFHALYKHLIEPDSWLSLESG